MQKWTRKWQLSTSAEFSDRTLTIRDDPNIFDWLDFESIPLQLRLSIRDMVDQWDAYAEDREINLHTEVFNNFHPILISQGKVRGRPSVAWPVIRVEMLGLSHLTSRSDSKAVTSTTIDQTTGSWLTTVDRLVVVDVITDNFPSVMMVLENPFASRFRDLGGQDFVTARHELLKKLFSWPSSEVAFHSSLVSFELDQLRDVAKWLELLGTNLIKILIIEFILSFCLGCQDLPDARDSGMRFESLHTNGNFHSAEPLFS